MACPTRTCNNIEQAGEAAIAHRAASDDLVGAVVSGDGQLVDGIQRIYDGG
jgi:hypothetical protein